MKPFLLQQTSKQTLCFGATITACDDVEDGQIAAVRIGESYALRRVYHCAGSIELRAENPSYPPILTQEVEILGVAVKALCSVC